MKETHPAKFTVNGRPEEVEVEPRRTLADVLRHDLGYTGTHVGCEHGICGACTVLLDGLPARSCLLFGVQADGCEVETVEGLESDGRAQPVAGGVFHTSRLTVRVLHPRVPDAGNGFPQGELRPYGGGDAGGDVLQPLPVHGLPGDHRGGVRRRGQEPEGRGRRARDPGRGGRGRLLPARRWGPRSVSAVGKRVGRLEDRRLLRGLGHFVDDVRPSGAAVDEGCEVPARPRAAWWRRKRRAALALPGVETVLTGEDLATDRPDTGSHPIRARSRRLFAARPGARPGALRGRARRRGAGRGRLPRRRRRRARRGGVRRTAGRPRRQRGHRGASLQAQGGGRQRGHDPKDGLRGRPGGVRRRGARRRGRRQGRSPLRGAPGDPGPRGRLRRGE